MILKINKDGIIKDDVKLPELCLYGSIDDIFFYVPINKNFNIRSFCIRICVLNKWHWEGGKYGKPIHTKLFKNIKRILICTPEIMKEWERLNTAQNQSRQQSRYDIKLPQKLTTQYNNAFRARPDCGQRCKSELTIRQQAVRPEKYGYERLHVNAY